MASNQNASGHTVHCLPAIGTFFSMFNWKNFFFILAKVGQWKEYFFFIFEILRCFRKKKNLKKIKAVLRETELKTEFPIYFRQNEKKIIKWNVTRENELILDQFFKK